MNIVILDRDGVINEDSDDYIKSAEEWIPIEGSLLAISLLSSSGVRVVVATNQSGIGRGYFSESDLQRIHHKMCSMVEDAGGKIAQIFFCPHQPEENCRCRKPKPGLLENIAAAFSVDLHGVPFIGDSLKDIQVAKAVGCTPILVKTGKGVDTLSNATAEDLREVLVFENLLDATRTLLKDRR